MPRLGVIVNPRAATCELLEDGDRAELGDGVVGLSDTHTLMRCTELSKLLYTRGQNCCLVEERCALT